MHNYMIALVGGVLIGAAAVSLMATLGRVAGISGILGGMLPPTVGRDGRWRVPFLVGLVLGPLVVAAVTHVSAIGAPIGGTATMVAGGLLVGAGTALGRGCTSGHGVCGMALLSVRSVTATVVFMAVAVATVFLVRHVF